MKPAYIEDKLYDGTDFKQTTLKQDEYEACRFHHCDFSGTDLFGITLPIAT